MPGIKQVTKDRFIWIAEQPPGTDPGADLFPDAVEIRTVRLTLETISKERLQQRKQILEKQLGDLIRRRFDRIEDLETLAKKQSSASGSSRASEPRPGSDLPGFTNPAQMSLQDLSGLYSDAKTCDAKPDAAIRLKGELPEGAPVDNCHRMPLTAHEAMKQLVPGLSSLIGEVTREIGKTTSVKMFFMSFRT